MLSLRIRISIRRLSGASPEIVPADILWSLSTTWPAESEPLLSVKLPVGL